MPAPAPAPAIPQNQHTPASTPRTEIDVNSNPALQGENRFALLAYSPGQQDDESDIPEGVESEDNWVELSDYIEYDSLVWSYGIAETHSDYNGRILYQSVHKSIFLRCEGENIAFVEFIADEGASFIRATILMEDGRPVINSGGSFVTLTKRQYGNHFTLESIEEITEDFMLFVGRTIPNGEDIRDPLNITVRAIATFTDGSTQEISILVR